MHGPKGHQVLNWKKTKKRKLSLLKKFNFSSEFFEMSIARFSRISLCERMNEDESIGSSMDCNHHSSMPANVVCWILNEFPEF